MALRRLLSSVGVNAPSVETLLERSAIYPGQQLPVTVVMRGGGADVEVGRLVVELVVRVEESEPTETEWNNPQVVTSFQVDRFVLRAGSEVPYKGVLEVPWGMPLTHVLGAPLKGGRCAVRTTIEIDNAVDKGDFDELQVHGLPVHDAMFRAFADHGYRFDEAEVKAHWRNHHTLQTLPYCQELEFWYPPAYRNSAQLEMVLIVTKDMVEVIPGSVGAYQFAPATLDHAWWSRWIEHFCEPRWSSAV
ncbi:sporulation protein [Spirillospora sp. NBC_00431]